MILIGKKFIYTNKLTLNHKALSFLNCKKTKGHHDVFF